MSEIYGIDSRTFHSLPPEDQQAVRTSFEQAQSEATEPAPAAEVPEPVTFATADTPAEAVEAIHGLPLPSASDLPRGLPQEDRDAIYGSRVEAFNERRTAQAQAVLDRMQPQLTDFAALNGATASMEYRDASNAFNSDPYVQELRRIVDEATTSPGTVPAYLQPGNAVARDTARLDLGQVTDVLATLGIQMPANPTAEQIQAGYDIVATLPDGVFAWAINPGQQVNFETPVAGVATLPKPVRGSADIRVIGEVDMSGVQTGIDFNQTQTLEMSVQVQGTVTAAVGRTPLNRMYEWAGKLGALPPAAQQMVESSPLLRNVVKGLPIPVSGHYSEFAGTRLTYEAVVSPEQGERINGGDLSAAPDPLDPMSMPVGTGVLIRGQTLTGSQFEANYRLFHVGGESTSLEGQGFGVQRIDENIVEVTAGDVDTVESDLFAGLGYRGIAAVGISADRSLEERSMSVARIDLRTEEGRAAYQQFISTGQVPAWSPPGVVQSGTTEIVNGDHTARVGIEVGGFGWGTETNSSEFNLVATTWADGSADYTNSARVGDDHYAQVTWSTDASGERVPGSLSYGLVLANHHGDLAGSLVDSYRTDMDDLENATQTRYDGDQHVRLEFTEAELMQLRQNARDFMESTNPDRLEALESQDMGGTSLYESLALAETADEVFQVVANDFYSEELGDSFLGLALQTGENTPGTITVRGAE
jgi:hypothetical protein